MAALRLGFIDEFVFDGWDIVKIYINKLNL